MGAFTPAITIPSTYALMASDAPSKPDPSQRLQAWALQHTMEADPPGWYTGDRYNQTNHFKDVAYIAIRAFMDAVAGAQVTAVRRNPGAVRKSIATPGQQSRDEDYTPVEPDHPLARVLENPNGEDGPWTMSQELAYLTLQQQLTGTAPAWTPFNAGDRPVRFFALPSFTTQPQFQPGQNPQYPHGAWRVTPYTSGAFFGPGGLGMTTLLPGEEVKRFRNPSPYNRWDGYSPLTGGARTVDILEAIDRSRWAAMDRGVRLDAALIIPGASAEEVERLQGQFTQKHGGADNHGKFLVVAPPGGMSDKFDLKTFSAGAKEMDYTGSWDQCVGAVLALFRVPKSVAGLATATSYSELYAALRQFNELALKPFARQLSDFLTKALAAPWSDEPGELKIQVELPTLDDPDLLEKQLAADTGIRTVNQRLAVRNLPAVEGGDVPEQIYLKWLDAKTNPQPDPMAGGMPGMEGAEGGDQPQDPGDGATGETDPSAGLVGGGDEPTGDDSEEGTQDAVTAAALASMGLSADDAGTVQKARKVRNEGEKWNVGENWYTKRNGKTVGIGDPTKAAPAPAAADPAPSKPAAAPAEPAPPPGTGGSEKATRAGGAGRAAAARGNPKSWYASLPDHAKADVHGHLASASRGGAVRSPDWLHDSERSNFNALVDQSAGSKKPPVSAPTAPAPKPAGAPATPAPAAPEAPGGGEFGRHDAAARSLLNGRKSVTLTDGAGRAHEVADGKSLKAYYAAGGRVPREALEAAAVAVPASTPVAKATLSKAHQWAGAQADKHADRVAAHFGISREKAHALLTHAITQVAAHAAKTGGTVGTLNIRDKRSGKTATLSAAKKPGTAPAPTGAAPTGGAVPSAPNPAADGSRPPAAPRPGLLRRAAGAVAGGVRTAGRAYATAIDRGIQAFGTEDERADARDRIADRRTRKAIDPGALWDAVGRLLAIGDDEAADALLAALDEDGTVAKAMSAYADGSGGVLVSPAGGPVPKKKRRKRADVGAAVSRCLKAMYDRG